MSGLIVIFLAVIGLACLCLYFLPSGIAQHRNHPSVVGIFLLNLFLGWSLVGWVVALVWAVSGPPWPDPSKPSPIASSSPTKRCPACAEEVLAAARKCKHCGEQLTG